jgi:hypothetical protein
LHVAGGAVFLAFLISLCQAVAIGIAAGSIGQKSPNSFLPKAVTPTCFGELPMRIVPSIFIGSVAVLAALASPVSAKNSNLNSHANTNAQVPDAQATDEAPSPPGCHAYQQGPDGTWIETACHEGVESAPSTSHGKSVHHGG